MASLDAAQKSAAATPRPSRRARSPSLDPSLRAVPLFSVYPGFRTSATSHCPSGHCLDAIVLLLLLALPLFLCASAYVPRPPRARPSRRDFD